MAKHPASSSPRPRSGRADSWPRVLSRPPTVAMTRRPARGTVQTQDNVYKLLVQSITGYAIYMLDMDGIVVTWNAGAKQAKGYEDSEIVGRHYSCFYRVEERLAHTPILNLDMARQTGKFEGYGWRVRKDGSQFWAHVIIDALRDAQGEVYGFAKITRECEPAQAVVTTAKELASEQEKRFRYLVQGISNYAIYMLDLNGVVANWNVGAERTKGYLADEIVGQHYSRFFTPEDQAAGLPAEGLAKALADGKLETEGWRVRKDGSRFWAHVIIDPIYDDDGRLFGYAKLTRDRTEANLMAQQTIDYERRFRLLVEGVTDYAIYMLHPDGVVSNWNAGAERAKGYTAAEIVGKHFSCFYEEAERLQGLPSLGLETARNTGKFEAQGWRLRKDQSRFWAHVVIQPIYDDDKTLLGFAKITRDCTEQRDASLALEETTHNLDLALENMLQGLCLFNQDGRLVVANEEFTRLLDLPANTFPIGSGLQQMLQRICQSGAASDENVADIRQRARHIRTRLLQGNTAGKLPGSRNSVEFRYSGRTILVQTRRLSHGGWVSTLEDITERRTIEQRIHHLAHHDSLTGLPNRVRFQEHLRQLQSSGPASDKMALLYLDLDRFKVVNDTLGHHHGDLLLREVALRLRGALRSDDLLARLSGDEFAILQSGCKQVSDATRLAQRCIDALSQPFDIDNNAVSIGVSIGIVCETRGRTVSDSILQHADLALYKAKREGRNIFCVYEHGMHDPLRLRNEMENDIRQALREDAFEIHYQPIVDALTGETTACEALLRWQHPLRGNIPPAEFIPVAEERMLMQELGAWVLMRACQDAASWPKPVRLAVNVSPAQLIYDDFPEILAHALTRSRLAPERLELEITESALLDQSGIPSRTLKAIRELGIGVAMDDFGTGYSSLNMLQNFPFTRVKIDRSFIEGLGKNPKSTAIVRSIASLCESLNIDIIAEGVETQAQREALLQHPCGELQGYLISRPVPMSSLREWFSRSSPFPAA